MRKMVQSKKTTVPAMGTRVYCGASPNNKRKNCQSVPSEQMMPNMATKPATCKACGRHDSRNANRPIKSKERPMSAGVTVLMLTVFIKKINITPSRTIETPVTIVNFATRTSYCSEHFPFLTSNVSESLFISNGRGIKKCKDMELKRCIHC